MGTLKELLDCLLPYRAPTPRTVAECEAVTSCCEGLRDQLQRVTDEAVELAGLGRHGELCGQWQRAVEAAGARLAELLPEQHTRASEAVVFTLSDLRMAGMAAIIAASNHNSFEAADQRRDARALLRTLDRQARRVLALGI